MSFPAGTFDDFNNGVVTVTRSTGTRGADGYTETATSTVLQTKCDLQEQSGVIERLQSRYDATLTAMVYCRESMSSVAVGDDVSVALTNGRTVSGTVVETRPLDDAFVI